MPLFRGKKKLDYISLVKAASPYAYWPLTETAAGTAYDVTGNGFNMTIGANVTFVDSDGGRKMGGCITSTAAISTTYDATNSACTATDTALWTHMASSTAGNDKTYEGWFRFPVKATNTSANFLLSAGRQTCAVFADTNRDKITVWCRGATDPASTIEYTRVLGGWVHVVVTTTPGGAGGAVMTSTYIDGALKAANFKTYTIDASNVHGLVLLGQNATGSGLSYQGLGSVAHVAYYKRVLTQQEITLHYEYGKNG